MTEWSIDSRVRSGDACRASAILARAQRRDVRPNIWASRRSDGGLPACTLSRYAATAASSAGLASIACSSRGPLVRPPGSRPSSTAGRRPMRCWRPALSMMGRWPRTGSACKPATRSRNADWPRCSDAHPAAGREPESPMHGAHRRSQTHPAARLRLNRTPWRHPGERGPGPHARPCFRQPKPAASAIGHAPAADRPWRHAYAHRLTNRRSSRPRARLGDKGPVRGG